MKSKSLLLSSIIGTTLLATSLSAAASEIKFKVAIIEDAPKSQAIIAGDYDAAITSLASTNSFEEQTSLCVAYIKSDKTVGSESACTAAIQGAKKLQAHSSKARYLRSISYSNRAIYRYQNNDISGAMDDLMVATKIDSNPITKANMSLLKSSLIMDSSEEDTMSAE